MVAVDTVKAARVASVVAATAVSLACGTNYAYSAWGPEFAKHQKLSATQANVIGAAGNIGMYAMGIPSGILNDNANPRWGVLLGAILLGSGYFPIHTAYDKGPGAVSFSTVAFCSFLTGFGSCVAFSAAIKVATMNWPEHRGTATAFPVSGFGLSAFFFATLGSIAFKNDASSFLYMLAFGTVILCAGALPFMRIIPTSADYSALPSDEEGRPGSRHSSSRLHRTNSSSSPTRGTSFKDSTAGSAHRPSTGLNASEESSLLGDLTHGSSTDAKPLNLEVTGVRLLVRVDFWFFFAMLALLAGVGLMTINNIGNDAAALWHAYDPKAPHEFIHSREQMHVSILSLGSFGGRILSGIGSDFLVKQLRASRLWCLIASATTLSIAQVFALNISNPNYLFLVSGFTGLGYGALFGCFPALVADAFGVSGLALNWGFMIMAPVISSNFFNIAYGRILDANSPKGDAECEKGLSCYRDAYWVTLISSIVGMGIALGYIRKENARKANMLRRDS